MLACVGAIKSQSVSKPLDLVPSHLLSLPLLFLPGLAYKVESSRNFQAVNGTFQGEVETLRSIRCLSLIHVSVSPPLSFCDHHGLERTFRAWEHAHSHLPQMMGENVA